jgi:hypothetical protein
MACLFKSKRLQTEHPEVFFRFSDRHLFLAIRHAVIIPACSDKKTSPYKDIPAQKLATLSYCTRVVSFAFIHVDE